MKWCKYAVWFLTLACMAAIFCFSAENADKSDNTSQSVTKQVLSGFPSFRKLPEERQTEIVENVQFSVRKLAHFSIYTCLGMLMRLSFCFIPVKGKKAVWSFCACVLYAMSDEFHQYFVPGRSCEVRDVCIDSLGALAGTLIVVTIIYFVCRHKRKKNLQ